MSPLTRDGNLFSQCNGIGQLLNHNFQICETIGKRDRPTKNGKHGCLHQFY